MSKGDRVGNNCNNNAAPIELRSASEVQQSFAEASTLHSEIVWDVLGPDQADILVKKLEYLYPDDKNSYATKQDIRKAKRHNANVKEIRIKLFRNIWQQRKYTNGVLLHSIIYVIVTTDSNVEDAKFSHNYTIHPIFRTRRCLNSNSSSDCCMIFIDEQSRVYQNWNDFVKNNELPIGTMVAPINGCYKLNNNNEVQLECSLTPSYEKQSLRKVDNLVSAASVVGQATSLLHPAFSLLTIGAKTYETIRDYQNMSDKVQHETTTSLSANLNLGGNLICLTSSVVTLGAYMTVPSGGALSYTAGMTIQAINGAATLINCTKLILTTYDIFTRYFVDEEENLVFKDIVAFSSSLLLLTNSINNMVIVEQLGKVGGNTLRSLLQNKIKAGLSLVATEVVRFADYNCGSYDLMRLVNDIPYKDVLSSIHTIYANLKKTGFLTTISVLGVVALEVVPGLVVQITDNEITQLDYVELTKHFGSKFVKHIANTNNVVDVLNGMGVYFSDAIIQFLLQQTRIFIDTTVDMLETQQNTLITTEMILFKMFTYVVKNYKDLSLDFLDKKRDDLIQGVTKYFQSLNPHPTAGYDDDFKRCCDVCGGYFYLVQV